MDKAQLVWRRPEDGLSVTLEMHINGEGLAHMILDAGGLERIIHMLAGVRAGMTEAVAAQLEPNAVLPVTEHPIWVAAKAQPKGNAVALAVRHPGFGWVSFLETSSEARALGNSVLALADELEGGAGD